jgi:hypothetical protein
MNGGLPLGIDVKVGAHEMMFIYIVVEEDAVP